jgi:molybdate transport system regulatory protein
MKKNAEPTRTRSLQTRLRVLCADEVALGPGKAELLSLLTTTGSIAEAAKRMNMSYMRAWSLIQMMNKFFKKPVIQATRGGRERGGAQLTETGRRALALYQRMDKAALKAVRKDWQSLKKILRD